MDTFPIVPEGLAEDLAMLGLSRNLVIRWEDDGETKETHHSWMEPHARVHLVFRPYIEVVGRSTKDGEPEVVVTIPLELVVAIEMCTELRWGRARDQSKGLLPAFPTQ